MKVLLDVNIWIDIAARPKSYPDSLNLYRKLNQQGHGIYLPLSGYTTIYYLLRNTIGEIATLEFVNKLKKNRVVFLPFLYSDLQTALTMQFGDHEDGCIAAIAFNNKCDYIATRNTKDFKRSPIQALTPRALLAELSS